MGSNSSSSKERTKKRTGDRKSGEQGRGCAWAESQRVRCCQQQQQRQERQQQQPQAVQLTSQLVKQAMRQSARVCVCVCVLSDACAACAAQLFSFSLSLSLFYRLHMSRGVFSVIYIDISINLLLSFWHRISRPFHCSPSHLFRRLVSPFVCAVIICTCAKKTANRKLGSSRRGR